MASFILFCVWMYLWKSGGNPINNFWVAHSWFPYNLSKSEFDTTDVTCLGTFFNEVFSILVEQGCCTWERFPYDTARMDCFRKVPDPLMPVASKYTMATPLRVSTTNPAMLRYHLARNEPVAFAMGIDTAFKYGGLRAGRTGDPFRWRPGCADPMPGSHAMLLVGYDDADSSFLVMNSWGARWGEAGYCRLDYDVFDCHATEAYIASDAVEGMWPATPLLIPGKEPLEGEEARVKLSMAQAVSFNDLTIGVSHLAADQGRVRVHLYDQDRAVKVNQLDLVEDRPVQFHRGDTLVTMELQRTSKRRDPRRARARLQVQMDPEGRDKTVDRALQQAARIREARGE